MLADFADPAVFWLAQCHNPHAREWSDRPAVYNLYFDVMWRDYGGQWTQLYWDHAQRYKLPAWNYIHKQYDAAFGARAAETFWSRFESPICRPEEVIVLYYTVDNDPCPHFTAACRAQLWAWKKIRAGALERYLNAVRALLRPHALGQKDMLGQKDIADVICTCLSAWHAGLPHEDARPRGPRWRGLCSYTQTIRAQGAEKKARVV